MTCTRAAIVADIRGITNNAFVVGLDSFRIGFARHLGTEIGVDGEVLNLHSNLSTLDFIREILAHLLEVTAFGFSVRMADKKDGLAGGHL